MEIGSKYLHLVQKRFGMSSFSVPIRFFLTACASSAFILGCHGRTTVDLDHSSTLLSSKVQPGSVTVARLAPPITNSSGSGVSSSFGFMGSDFTRSNSSNLLPSVAPNTILLTLSNETIALNSPATGFKSARASGLNRVTPGNYSIAMKLENPSWYAPDTYFSKRELSVPPANDRLRYRKGAFGSAVVYLNNGIPIHSSEIEDSDVEGIKVPEDLMTSLIELANPSTGVIVK